ncbi:hypothetical protein BB559_004047 [Furculomyces boomerangus]|uniref:Uncharacterized protein n=2 Tax=Harpellales TaxID=61421 RepID=A0A2T9YH42_9FUNG|nr:hypothetical protein BB559_004047 [Furculomyces boomerangus]PWA03808.1 hypothetical protein BB558_000025 [Smittium angustum]
MADINKHFNESKTIRDILEAGDYNATIGLSKVLIIYTGGTIGMVYDDVKGYTPVDDYLAQYLKSQSRFYDQNGFNDLDQLERSDSTDSIQKMAKSDNLVKKVFTKNETKCDTFSEWLITPKMIHGKRIK